MDRWGVHSSSNCRAARTPGVPPLCESIDTSGDMSLYARPAIVPCGARTNLNGCTAAGPNVRVCEVEGQPVPTAVYQLPPSSNKRVTCSPERD
jgi:hypothetical protein